MEGSLQMKRGLSFTILALLGLLASVAMAMDNNWPGAALGCVAAGLPLCHGNRLVPTLRAIERAVDAGSGEISRRGRRLSAVVAGAACARVMRASCVRDFQTDQLACA